MATPVPVVSMLYFLVSSPPKTVVAVRPAFWAMSVKCATGADGLAAWAHKEVATRRILSQTAPHQIKVRENTTGMTQSGWYGPRAMPVKREWAISPHSRMAEIIVRVSVHPGCEFPV